MLVMCKGHINYLYIKKINWYIKEMHTYLQSK